MCYRSRECEHLLALTPHDRLRMTTEMLQRLQRPPFTNQLNHAEQVLRWSMQVETPDENPNQTAADMSGPSKENRTIESCTTTSAYFCSTMTARLRRSS